MWTFIQNKNWEHLVDTFEWVRDMKGVPQDPVFHAEGDVAIHTQMVINSLIDLAEYQTLPMQEQEILFAAALLHDVEKRSTTVVEEDGRITSRGHARKGELTARSLLYRQGSTPFEIRETIAKLVRYHGLPLWIFDKEDPQKAIIQASLEVRLDLLTILAKADVLGRICPDQPDLLYRVELFREFALENKCLNSPRIFKNDLSRFLYFQKQDLYPEYEAFVPESFEVLLLCALPGTGKDTFIKKHLKDWPIVSLDDLRRKNGISPTDKKGKGKIIQIAQEKAKEHLRARQPFVWNATNILRLRRSKLIQLFHTYGARCKIVYLEVPYNQLVLQNSQREFMVPNKVLERMTNGLEVPAIWEAEIVEYKVKS